MAKASVLLRRLPPEAQAFIHRSCKLTKMKEGQMLYAQGSQADAWYMVESGKYCATQKSSDGHAEHVMHEFTQGETFGSHDLLLGSGERGETLTAVEEGALWKLPKKAFDAKIKQAPAPSPKTIERMRAVKHERGADLVILTCPLYTSDAVDEEDIVDLGL